MSQHKKILVYIGILFTMLFWSYSFLWYKDVYHYLPPFTTIFFRLLVSSVLLLIVSVAFGKLERIRKADIKYVFLLAFFEPFLYFVGESQGMLLVTPTTASVIVSVIPLLIPFFAFLFLKERVSIKNILGILVSFFGVLLVIMNRNFELTASGKGVMLMSVSVVSAIFYAIVLKKLAATYNPFTLITLQNTIGAVMFLPLMLYYDLPVLNTGMMTLQALIPILKLAIFASSIAFMLYTYAIQMLGAVKTNIFTNLIPVMTAFLSFIFLGEQLLVHNLIGILLVIGGLILSQTNPLKKLTTNWAQSHPIPRERS